MTAETVSADIVAHIDPDWRDHFGEVDDAYEFYYRYSHAEFCVAYREVTGEEWQDND
jgi:hypothetical protein